MLMALVERYISLRQTLGYKLRDLSHRLRAFATFAAGRGDTHVRASTAVDWATEALSPDARYVRLRNVVHLARFLRAEDPAHEIPSNPFFSPKRRRLPYIYRPEEIVQLVEAASRLRESYPLRRQVYGTLLALIASTGLRISEALDLRPSACGKTYPPTRSKTYPPRPQCRSRQGADGQGVIIPAGGGRLGHFWRAYRG